jgi:membrane dipeptidase
MSTWETVPNTGYNLCFATTSHVHLGNLSVGALSDRSADHSIRQSERVTWIWDGHNDYAWEMRGLAAYDLDRYPFDQPIPALHTDLPRLHSGGVGAQFWSVFVPCSYQGERAVTATLEQITFVRRLVERYPDDLCLARGAAQVEAAASAGKVACLMGMEGGHQIADSLDVLSAMHTLGVRYLTLTHNENVSWADSATDVRVVGGLSDFGRTVVRHMNALGMFVDLSHVSADVMHDALDTTNAPIIFSHSSARALCDHPRNVPDDVLGRLSGNGGICMVTFVPRFVSQPVWDWYQGLLEEIETAGGDRRDSDEIHRRTQAARAAGKAPSATIDDVVAHCSHVREIVGIEHVGIGGDYDGSATLPDGLEDVSTYPRLLDALRDKGWSEADLDGLAHGNVLRAMHEMESVATGAVR